MSKKHYLVIILDVNSIPRESPLNQQSEEEGFPSPTEGHVEIIPYKYSMIKSVKEMVITLLAKEALQYHCEKFNFSQVLWSFKLYNSSYEINSKTGRSFTPISVESIEAFEKQLESYLDVTSLSALKSNSNINKIQFLSTSLKSVIGDLPWPESSSSYMDGLGSNNDNQNRNVIHAMFRIPKTEPDVEDFIPSWSPTAGSKAIMNELLPKAFCRKLKDHHIQVNFMDLWPAFTPEQKNTELHWESEIASPMAKIAHFLRGTITTFTQISQGVPLGLPSYAVLLKLLITDSMKMSSTTMIPKNALEDTQKTLLKLQGSMNGSVIKAMHEDTDVESVRSNGVRIVNPSNALARYQRRSFPENVQPRMSANIDDRNHLWSEHVGASGGGRHSNIRRFSDERDHRRRVEEPRYHQEEPKKRKYKYSFEEDMESEEGYSPYDIENWCIEGKVRPQGRYGRPQMRKNVQGKDRYGQGQGQPVSGKYKYGRGQPAPGKYKSPQIYQPQKRIRRTAAIETRDSDDECSVSSVNSSICGPDDSISQVRPHDNSFGQRQRMNLSQQLNQSQNSQRTSFRTASFLTVNNPKRPIMLPVAKPLAKPKIYHHKPQSQSTQSGTLKHAMKSPKPKKVRRNLFDVQASRDPKDMKMLLNLATTNTSSFSRSPSLFKSPMSKLNCSPRSPGRPSPFFALARAANRVKTGRSSRRRLVLDEEEPSHKTSSSVGIWGTMSDSPNENPLCPESPYTPKVKKTTPSGSRHGSTGAISVVKESPEVAKTAYSSSYKHSSRRIDSVSFYSSGNQSLKARAWERSGAKLMAAKIRDSVDFSQSLTIDNFEFINTDSPSKSSIESNRKKTSPRPCSSRTGAHQHFEVAPIDEVHPNIQALMCSEIVSSPSDILNSSANLPFKSPGLDTPSKRVQFSAELVSSPSPTTPIRPGSSTPMTPKSILKDAGNTHSNI